MGFSTLDSSIVLSLENPFSDEEIFSELKNSNGNKAPGPDGLPLKFAQSY